VDTNPGDEAQSSKGTQGSSDPSTWVEKYGDYLYRNAMLRLRDRELAEEAVQETFLAALSARSRFSGRSTEKTWLVGILKHKIIDALRKLSREVPVEDVDLLPSEEERPFYEDGEWRGHWRKESGAAPRDWGKSPARALEDKEFWRVFHQCVSGLPPRLARAFTLREVDGLAGSEICKVLGITSTNFWVMLHRSRLQLRRCIEVHWFGADNGGGDT